MRTIVCNSVQSFIDMAENELLTGMHVHCVFPVSDTDKNMFLSCQEKYQIKEVSFSKAVEAKEVAIS